MNHRCPGYGNGTPRDRGGSTRLRPLPGTYSGPPDGPPRSLSRKSSLRSPGPSTEHRSAGYPTLLGDMVCSGPLGRTTDLRDLHPTDLLPGDLTDVFGPGKGILSQVHSFRTCTRTLVVRPFSTPGSSSPFGLFESVR